LTEDRIQGHHLPVFSEEKEVVMAIEQVLQEKFPDYQSFNPPESPDQETDAGVRAEEVIRGRGDLGETRARGLISFLSDGSTTLPQYVIMTVKIGV
jgi:hypothetical protein